LPSLQTCQATAGPPCATDALAEHYNYREVLAERPHLGPNVHAARSQAGSVKSNAVQKKRQQTPRSSRKSGASIFADVPMSPPANPQALRVKKRGAPRYWSKSDQQCTQVFALHDSRAAICPGPIQTVTMGVHISARTHSMRRKKMVWSGFTG